MLALWDGPRQREAYDWFDVELANLRAAFRWAADHGDLDTAAAIAVLRGRSSATGSRQYEPVAWAEELIEPAKADRPPATGPALRDGRAMLYMTGRIDDFLGYAEAGQAAMDSGRFEKVPDEFEA